MQTAAGWNARSPERSLRDGSTEDTGPRTWRPALLALGLGLLLLGFLFRAEVAAAVRTWETSTAYNHGWLVLPIALWLAWARRHRLAALAPRPAPLLALLAIPAGLAWLVAERMGIMEGRQFGALGLLYALLLAVLGWRVCRAMAAPLAYLVFLVPFGEFTVPALQTITARMVDFGLSLTGIPHYVDDLIIEIPEGTFYVAEACAGLRFIIAALAFGALYAFVMFRSPGRRLIVMLLALVVPILANGLRAFGLVILGHIEGSAAAVAADHVLYGWMFFSIVILLLILAGLPFREDGAPPAVLPGREAGGGRPAPRGALALATGLAMALTLAGPALAALLESAGGEPPRSVAARLAAPAGCEAVADGRLRCGGTEVSARLLAFPARVNWNVVAAERRRAVGSASDEDVTFDVPMPGGGAWRGRQPQDAPVTLAAAAWLDGRPVGDGLRSRAGQALKALRGGAAGGPVVAVVEMRSDGPSDLSRDRTLMRAVLESQGGHLTTQAAELSLGHAAGQR